MVGRLIESEHAKFALLLLPLAYLYLLLFVPLLTPIDAGIGDDRLFLCEAQRILDGQIIYRDFFEFYFPGADLFYALLFRLFGLRAWIPNVCLLGMGIGFVWTSTVISRKLVNGVGAILPGLLFLPIAYRWYLDAVPHWYSNFLIMIAIAVLAQERSPVRLMIAGVITALATFFAQSHGAFAAAGVATFLLWEGRRDADGWRHVSIRELYFLVPFGSIVLLCVGYFVREAGFRSFFSSTILYPIKYWKYSELNRWSAYIVIEIGYQALLHRFHLLRLSLLALLVPGVYLIAIAGYLRQARTPPDKQWRCIILLSAVGLATFGSIVNGATYWRVATVSAPAFIILVWLVERRLGVKGTLALWTIALIFMTKDIRFAQTGWTAFLDTPSGRVALTPGDPASLYEWLAINTHPGEYVFEAGGWDIYFWFDVENPTKLPCLYTTGLTRPEQLNDAIRDLEQRRVQLILWSNDLDSTGNASSGNYLEPARNYLHSHYRKLRTFAGDTGGQIFVWERTYSH